MAWAASPRNAKPLPDTMGETAVTSGNCSSTGISACQLATERRRWARGWASASTRVCASVARALSTVSSGARTLRCDWAPKVLVMVLLCSPLISAEMYATTATPAATPMMMRAVCIRPSRRKRRATRHSNPRVSAMVYYLF